MSQSRVTKNNLLISRFTEKKSAIINQASRMLIIPVVVNAAENKSLHISEARGCA